MNIKEMITFTEFNAIVDNVVNKVFAGDTYNPAYYDIALRDGVLQAYAPDYRIDRTGDIDTYYNSLYTEEATEIYHKVFEKGQFVSLVDAVNNAIEYRKQETIAMISAMRNESNADLALAGFIDKLTEFVDKMSENTNTGDTKKFIDTVNGIGDNLTAENMVKAMADNGLINKPNRETRRKNIKNNKTPNGKKE